MYLLIVAFDIILIDNYDLIKFVYVVMWNVCVILYQYFM